MIRFYSSYFLVFTCFTHSFCCGLPLLLGISSFSTNFLFFASEFFEIELLETIELVLFSIASIILISLVSFEVNNFKTKKIEEENCCDNNYNASSRKKVKKNIVISAILYVVNIVFLLSERVF